MCKFTDDKRAAVQAESHVLLLPMLDLQISPPTITGKPSRASPSYNVKKFEVNSRSHWFQLASRSLARRCLVTFTWLGNAQAHALTRSCDADTSAVSRESTSFTKTYPFQNTKSPYIFFRHKSLCVIETAVRSFFSSHLCMSLRKPQGSSILT